jgi:fatty acid desaturase
VADGSDPKEEARAALEALDRGIGSEREARGRSRRPRWFDVLVPCATSLVGATLVVLSVTMFWLPIFPLLILAIVSLFSGLLLVIVGMRSLARTMTTFFTAEAGNRTTEVSSGDDARL